MQPLATYGENVIQRKLGRQPCIANPSTVLKRNHAIKQQVSLFWMEPALGDAVMMMMFGAE